MGDSGASAVRQPLERVVCRERGDRSEGKEGESNLTDPCEPRGKEDHRQNHDHQKPGRNRLDEDHEKSEEEQEYDDGIERGRREVRQKRHPRAPMAPPGITLWRCLDHMADVDRFPATEVHHLSGAEPPGAHRTDVLPIAVDDLVPRTYLPGG